MEQPVSAVAMPNDSDNRNDRHNNNNNNNAIVLASSITPPSPPPPPLPPPTISTTTTNNKMVVFDSLPYIDTATMIHPDYYQPYAVSLMEQEMKKMPRLVDVVVVDRHKKKKIDDDAAQNLQQQQQTSVDAFRIRWEARYQQLTNSAATTTTTTTTTEGSSSSTPNEVVTESSFPPKPSARSRTNDDDDDNSSNKMMIDDWQSTIKRARIVYEKERMRSIQLDIDNDVTTNTTTTTTTTPDSTTTTGTTTSSSVLWKQYHTQVLQPQYEYDESLVQQQQTNVATINHTRQHQQTTVYGPSLSALQYQYQSILQNIHDIQMAISTTSASSTVESETQQLPTADLQT